MIGDWLDARFQLSQPSWSSPQKKLKRPILYNPPPGPSTPSASSASSSSSPLPVSADGRMYSVPNSWRRAVFTQSSARCLLVRKRVFLQRLDLDTGSLLLYGVGMISFTGSYWLVCWFLLVAHACMGYGSCLTEGVWRENGIVRSLGTWYQPQWELMSRRWVIAERDEIGSCGNGRNVSDTRLSSALRAAAFEAVTLSLSFSTDSNIWPSRSYIAHSLYHQKETCWCKLRRQDMACLPW